MDEINYDRDTPKPRPKTANNAETAFLANMSHELKTPLTAVLGFTGLLKRYRLGEEKREVFLDAIERNGKHLLKLVDGVLELSDLELRDKGAQEDCVHLQAILAESSNSLKESSTKTLPLCDVTLSSSLPPRIMTDRDKLERTIKHAVAYTAANTTASRLDITAQAFPPASNGRPELEIRVSPAGDPSSCSDGVGTEFSPFVPEGNPATTAGDSSGMDLTLIKRLSQKLGGDATVVPQGGSRNAAVCIRLPFHRPDGPS